jgi:hypothetical protein
MISEKQIASHFHSLWGEALPLLTPSYVRLFNEAFLDDLSEYPQSKLHGIAIGKNIKKHDLVAEFAFQLAKEANTQGVFVGELIKDDELTSAPFDNAVRFLSHYEPGNIHVLLNTDEVSESVALAEQYHLFFEHLNFQNVEFNPQISGSGFMSKCLADMSVGEMLYEVKTVNRNISGNDIRQLFLYLSLQAVTGDRKWTHAGFFNPRRALHYKFSIDHMIYKVSGGKSTSDVFHFIVDYLHRDIEVDAAF